MKMKKLATLAALLAMVIIVLPGVSVQAGEPEMMTPEQKAWMEYMTPGWAHEMMAKSVGKWETVTKFWHVPGMKPEVSNGKTESKMILGGRYVQSRYNGTSMGQPYEGMSLEAYDNVKKEFISIWIDNMGTGVAMAAGKISKDKKMIEYAGTMTDPMKNGESKYKSIVKFVNDDKSIFEMYRKMEGKEFKIMEMVSTRVK